MLILRGIHRIGNHQFNKQTNPVGLHVAVVRRKLKGSAFGDLRRIPVQLGLNGPFGFRGLAQSRHPGMRRCRTTSSSRGHTDCSLAVHAAIQQRVGVEDVEISRSDFERSLLSAEFEGVQDRNGTKRGGRHFARCGRDRTLRRSTTKLMTSSVLAIINSLANPAGRVTTRKSSSSS